MGLQTYGCESWPQSEGDGEGEGGLGRRERVGGGGQIEENEDEQGQGDKRASLVQKVASPSEVRLVMTSNKHPNNETDIHLNEGKQRHHQTEKGQITLIPTSPQNY
ncbi:hypothetical protein E2C01_050932 [Portunus trituberculatus]|uniref:Uncharacterized protein n=1 Tax=Portunus trituberculatus TaxID=210409 RepID=A0A5B7GHN4_PORTR|nr:hypothetical protein [Portunus trituberculatus]